LKQDNKKLIEAALFVAGKPISLAELYQVVKIPKLKIKKLIDEMREQYGERGLRIVELDGLYQMKVHSDMESNVSGLAPHKDFPKAVLQTLSLIAYKNPVKQSNVVEVRGNRAYDHLNELEDKGFIRREAAGHTNIIHITRKFLDYFGIESAVELKEYFGTTNIDDVLKDVVIKVKEKKPESKEVKEEVLAIDARDVSYSEDDELPAKLREIVERKKEVILKRRDKTGYLPEEARFDVSSVAEKVRNLDEEMDDDLDVKKDEVVVDKVENSDDTKDKVVDDESEDSCDDTTDDDEHKPGKKFKSSFEDVIKD